MQNLIIITSLTSQVLTFLTNNFHKRGHFDDILIQLTHLNAKQLK